MTTPQPVPLALALLRGLAMRCTACGKGHMFRRYLKVADRCEKCGEEFLHHEADDYPAYLVIALVGHAMFPIILDVELTYAPPFWLYAAVGLPAALLAVLGALQPVKGAVVALQWHLGLGGFETSKQRV